jgi:hypothetical protein
MARAQLSQLAETPISSEQCVRAAAILTYARESVGSLHDAMELCRQQRGRPRGVLTNQEQDILRAILIMAAAGLDAMTKQLIRDCLPDLIKISPQAQTGLRTFTQRRLRGETEGGDLPGRSAFLARVLAAPSHQSQIIEEYIDDLTGGSLQSAEALMRVCSALGLGADRMGIRPPEIQPIFDMRHAIVHELDIDFSNPRRPRTSRGVAAMLDCTNKVLQLAESVLRAADRALQTIP